MTQLQEQLNDVMARQVNQVKAPFKGKVSIPQKKTRDSAILNLTSEDYYVVGTVNEKDVEKLKVDQKRILRLSRIMKMSMVRLLIFLKHTDKVRW